MATVPSVVERELPDEEARDLLDLVAEIADAELAPHVDAAEADALFPRETFRTLGRAGLLGLPYPERYGGGGQPYVVYLQVIEELARRWTSVALGVSVHTLSCNALATAGTDEQRARWLPDLIGGELLGCYALSEAHAGSDAAALSTRAVLDRGQYVVDGTKAWTTHGNVADFCSLMVRTSDDGARGITCLLVPTDAPGFTAAPPEHKMGFRASPTTALRLDGVHVEADRRIGDEGEGFAIALAALDAGRLGIAACSVGLAQAALDEAVAWAGEREQFGRKVGDFQGMTFLLADLATQVAAARALYLAAARERDRGEPCGLDAAMAKAFASDTAMRVTTDAVQVLGGYGFVQDYPVERYFREAKALQLVEGTNQIQRLVIGRSLLKRAGSAG